MQSDCEIPTEPREKIPESSMSDLSSCHTLKTKLCMAPGLTRGNSREAEPLLSPTQLDETLPLACPEPCVQPVSWPPPPSSAGR